jgi:hypothetical protein
MDHQVIFVLVAGAIALAKWLMEKSAEQRKKREMEDRADHLGGSEPVAHPMQAPRPVAPFGPDPDVVARRLREALGLPAESELPARRVAPAPPPRFQVEEIKVIPAADLEQRVVAAPPPLPPPRVHAPSALVKPTASPFGLEELLRSRDGLRKAILAQEILGPPKGLVF